MLYNNLIYFLVVIFALSTDTPPDLPRVSPLFALPLLGAVYGIFFQACKRIFARVRGGGSRAYFVAETKLSILAVVLFVTSLHLLDLKYYLHPLSLNGQLPVLENIGGLVLFFAFLSLMWIGARVYYQEVFQRSHTVLSFILANMRANLPIIVPWVVLSFFFDALALLNIPGLQEIMDSPWGDLVLFGMFILFLLFFFPPMVRLLWNCKPLPAGQLRDRMESFCRQQGFISEILLWPLFEGQVITAGVMGIIPRLRYLLVTPALLSAMNWEELQAVLAHEIGHVKKKHLVLYIVLFLGFSLFAGAAVEPMPFFIIGSEHFYRLVEFLQISPEILLGVLVALLIMLLMIVYFRFVFGYFIRNFERQADLYVFRALGGSGALIRSFEKIAVLGGNIREQKSWHHFGIGERIHYLEKCQQDREEVRRHDRKVYVSLAVYCMVVVLSVLLFRGIDHGDVAAGYEIRYVEAILEHKLRQDPENGLLFFVLGNLMQEKKMEAKAVAAYEKALQLQPHHADILNNLAWLLLTSQDASLLDPPRALVLARKAVEIKEAGYILDTLAVAMWASNMPDEAAAFELKAAAVDPANERYYLQQRKRILARPWSPGWP